MPLSAENACSQRAWSASMRVHRKRTRTRRPVAILAEEGADFALEAAMHRRFQFAEAVAGPVDAPAPRGPARTGAARRRDSRRSSRRRGFPGCRVRRARARTRRRHRSDPIRCNRRGVRAGVRCAPASGRAEKSKSRRRRVSCLRLRNAERNEHVAEIARHRLADAGRIRASTSGLVQATRQRARRRSDEAPDPHNACPPAFRRRSSGPRPRRTAGCVRRPGQATVERAAAERAVQRASATPAFQRFQPAHVREPAHTAAGASTSILLSCNHMRARSPLRMRPAHAGPLTARCQQSAPAVSCRRAEQRSTA